MKNAASEITDTLDVIHSRLDLTEETVRLQIQQLETIQNEIRRGQNGQIISELQDKAGHLLYKKSESQEEDRQKFF